MPARIAHRALALIAFAAAALPASAQMGYRVDPNGKDELWEVQTTMEMQGMRMAMPGGAEKVCIEKGNDEASVPKQDGCTMVEGRRVGHRYRFKMACKKGKDDYTAEGENSYSGNSYEGWMAMKGTMDGRPADMKLTYAGKRAGNCVSTVKQDMAAAKAEGDRRLAQSCAEALDRLQWQLYEPNSTCASRRGEFSAAVAKVATSMRDPVQHTQLSRKYFDLKTVFAKYDQDYAAVTKAACARAVETRNWGFVGSGNCDDEVRQNARGVCDQRGRSPEQQFFPLCSRYAQITRGTASADDASSGSSGRAAAPARPPSPVDPVQQGVDAVRKLLPF